MEAFFYYSPIGQLIARWYDGCGIIICNDIHLNFYCSNIQSNKDNIVKNICIKVPLDSSNPVS